MRFSNFDNIFICWYNELFDVGKDFPKKTLPIVRKNIFMRENDRSTWKEMTPQDKKQQKSALLLFSYHHNSISLRMSIASWKMKDDAKVLYNAEFNCTGSPHAPAEEELLQILVIPECEGTYDHTSFLRTKNRKRKMYLFICSYLFYSKSFKLSTESRSQFICTKFPMFNIENFSTCKTDKAQLDVIHWCVLMSMCARSWPL